MSPRIQFNRQSLDEFCRRWMVAELSFFGSVIRSDFSPGSDVDVLVAFAADARWNLMDIVTMMEELRGIFGRDVDLVEKDAIRNPFRRHAILSSREIVYAA